MKLKFALLFDRVKSRSIFLKIILAILKSKTKFVCKKQIFILKENILEPFEAMTPHQLCGIDEQFHWLLEVYIWYVVHFLCRDFNYPNRFLLVYAVSQVGTSRARAH